MHLQESTLFDLDLQVKVTLNVAQCPLHHVTYAPTEFEVTMSKALGGEAFTRNSIFDLTLTFDLGVKVTQNVAQSPLHHVTHPATKFEVATSNGLGGDTFTRNVTDGRTHGWTDGRTDFDTKLIYPFFLKKKAGITNIVA